MKDRDFHPPDWTVVQILIQRMREGVYARSNPSMNACKEGVEKIMILSFWFNLHLLFSASDKNV